MNSKQFFILPLAFVSQFCQAAKTVQSPDGTWNVATVLQDDKPAIALFSAGGSQPETILDRDASYDTRVDVKWSDDSRRVFVLQHFPNGTGIDAAWFDGSKWHRTFEPDSDFAPLMALVDKEGLRGSYRSDTAELGKWISPDTIEVSGTLGYMGKKATYSIPYSYHLQIVLGSYGLNALGYDLGGLKASGYGIGMPEGEGFKTSGSPVPGTEYIFGQQCALTGKLKRSAQGAWVLELGEKIAVESKDASVQSISGISRVVLVGMSQKAAAYLATINGKTIKVSGRLKAPAPATNDEITLELSDEIVHALEQVMHTAKRAGRLTDARAYLGAG